jgi:hypothetical protein
MAPPSESTRKKTTMLLNPHTTAPNHQAVTKGPHHSPFDSGQTARRKQSHVPTHPLIGPADRGPKRNRQRKRQGDPGSRNRNVRRHFKSPNTGQAPPITPRPIARPPPGNLAPTNIRPKTQGDSFAGMPAKETHQTPHDQRTRKKKRPHGKMVQRKKSVDQRRQKRPHQFFSQPRNQFMERHRDIAGQRDASQTRIPFEKADSIYFFLRRKRQMGRHHHATGRVVHTAQIHLPNGRAQIHQPIQFLNTREQQHHPLFPTPLRLSRADAASTERTSTSTWSGTAIRIKPVCRGSAAARSDSHHNPFGLNDRQPPADHLAVDQTIIDANETSMVSRRRKMIPQPLKGPLSAPGHIVHQLLSQLSQGHVMAVGQAP